MGLQQLGGLTVSLPSIKRNADLFAWPILQLGMNAAGVFVPLKLNSDGTPATSTGGSLVVYNDTDAHTDTLAGFAVLSACVFTAVTGITGYSGVTFPAGMTFASPISGVTLASGTIAGYIAAT